MTIKLITAKQASERIGCVPSHIYNLVAAGELRRFSAGVTPGKALRVAEQDVDAFIKRREMPVAS